MENKQTKTRKPPNKQEIRKQMEEHKKHWKINKQKTKQLKTK